MKYSVNIFLFLILVAPLSVESSGPNYTNSEPSSLQFQSWYPQYRPTYENITAGPCASTLADYQASYLASPDSEVGSQLLTRCYYMEACVMQNLSFPLQANFQSSTVVLGLLPTLLAQLGPSIAETSLLSAHRPFLSLLVSLGAPSVWPTRVFELNSLAVVLEGRNLFPLKPFKPFTAIVISVIQYTCLAIAVWNVISTSIIMGRQSILVWACTTTYIPVLWTSLSSVVHIAASSSYMVAVHARRRQHSNTVLPKTSTSKMRIAALASSFKTVLGKIATAVKSETTTCANQPETNELVDLPPLAMFLNVAAGVMSFCHLAFGTIALPSLAFIGISDVMTQILPRYIASTIICRLVLLVEITGLRKNQSDK